MLTSKTRWNVKETSGEQSKRLAEALNIPLFIANLLIQRGIAEPDAASDFLYADKKEVHDPFLMKDMDKAVDRIKRAISEQEMILVYGDYDADGVTSTSVLLTALRELGAEAEFYIPNRFTEGYGPNEGAFRDAVAQGFSLIITVDNGISGVHEAQVLKELNTDLIITDHHEPGPELPEALAIIHPNHPESNYPFKELAGVGVAFKLAHALLGRVPDELLDLVAIGTIADLVPLHGENRILVKKGLKQLRATRRPGIHAILKKAGSNVSEADEETVGFAIGPRLNAVGRLSDADPAVDLLMTEDTGEAEGIAAEIDRLNKERQSIVAEITKEATEIVEEHYRSEGNRVLVLAKAGWNPGVVGIVASKLVEKYYRPVIILCIDEDSGKAKGSARSIEGFNMFQELSKNREILPHFGGHPMAAGMTLSAEHVDLLRENLNRQAESMRDEDFIPVTHIDVPIKIEDTDLKAIEQLNMLSPFGMKNAKPKVLVEQAAISSIRKIGANQNHLKVTLKQDDYSLDAIAFQLGEAADHISPLASIDVIGELSVNEWNNTRKPQLFIKDLRVKEWQLFDVRGITQPARWVSLVPENAVAVSFKKGTYDRFCDLFSGHELHLIEDHEQAKQTDLMQRPLVLLDLPEEERVLVNLINNERPSRLYAHFYHEDPQFFSAVPGRDQFAWFFAFLKKRGTFNLKNQGQALASHRGWSIDTINFMTKVFFELDFVTINDGFVSINEHIQKRDLTESPAYQRKTQSVKMEQELLYSSFHDLKRWFEERSGWTGQLEEEKVWI
ncbi:single-stranded-DNA-specific exonuclease RecJ [Jeotgalibacillus sp. R-1-5s-1]|uniref:single-stranded-DNA-specific exonuclease RecJ n=1 Tax=Jeotgalibacillus sp. R-1-5s-1 TaxID=2555897 RepID=UPI00106A76FD|nr:single-stranded-DNA-specific exonuclease RecJ [Jeotgalibacillus sp. R-1-5s-1]TFD92388.1 single-stranded-DNA-specific exonuclease RecJ [Jeotgalibacillus sp. R-1-5s-1]